MLEAEKPLNFPAISWESLCCNRKHNRERLKQVLCTVNNWRSQSDQRQVNHPENTCIYGDNGKTYQNADPTDLHMQATVTRQKQWGWNTHRHSRGAQPDNRTRNCTFIYHLYNRTTQKCSQPDKTWPQLKDWGSITGLMRQRNCKKFLSHVTWQTPTGYRYLTFTNSYPRNCPSISQDTSLFLQGA